MSKKERPCPTCFEAPNPDVSKRFFTASEWDALGAEGILSSLELGLRVLSQRAVPAGRRREHAARLAALIEDAAKQILELETVELEQH